MATLTDTTQLFKALADPTRVRLLSVLRAHTLTVGELCDTLALPQPRVSSHLRTLRDAELVQVRRIGGQAWYALTQPPSALVRSALDQARDPLLEQDRLRAQKLVDDRSQAWVDQVAGRMEHSYSPGRTWESLGRALATLAAGEQVLDVGTGDGAVAELIAPSLGHITCLDANPRVVDRARERLAHIPNLSVVLGDMHALPWTAPRFDRVMVLGALPYSADPEQVLAEAVRVLLPGGWLTVSTLLAHEHHAVAEQFGHLSRGHTPEDLRDALSRTGLTVRSCRVTSRERRRAPHFEVVTAWGRKETA